MAVHLPYYKVNTSSSVLADNVQMCGHSSCTATSLLFPRLHCPEGVLQHHRSQYVYDPSHPEPAQLPASLPRLYIDKSSSFRAVPVLLLLTATWDLQICLAAKTQKPHPAPPDNVAAAPPVLKVISLCHRTLVFAAEVGEDGAPALPSDVRQMMEKGAYQASYERWAVPTWQILAGATWWGQAQAAQPEVRAFLV